MEIIPGLSSSVTLVVSDSDTAVSARSGDVAVLGTPRLVALCEEASCRALDGCLDKNSTSVGARVELDHIAPTAPGDTVTVRAEVEKVEGRRIVFLVNAEDSRGTVATGRITRALVNREAFLSKLG